MEVVSQRRFGTVPWRVGSGPDEGTREEMSRGRAEPVTPADGRRLVGAGSS